MISSWLLPFLVSAPYQEGRRDLLRSGEAL
jgi:hypothetical protein